MHILMISDVYFPRVNGVSTSIQTFVRNMQDDGHEITLIAPDYPNNCDTDCRTIRIPSRKLPFDPEDRLMNKRKVIKQAEHLKDKNIDIVHIQTPFVAHYAGVEIARRLNVPVVVSYHTFFEAYFEKYLTWIPSSWLRGMARMYSRKQCSEVDGVISPSLPMLKKLREYGIKTRAQIIPTGLDLELFKLKGENHFREHHNIPEHAPMLTYVGRVAHEKNIDFLMDSFEQVWELKSDAQFMIAGEGPALDHLKKKASEMECNQNIHFCGYLDRNTDLIACYRSSTVFMFASETETQGLVLLEAMACHTPVVSTAVMGTKDVLLDGKGCLIALPKVDDFSEQVLRLLDEPALAAEIAEQGQLYVQSWSAENKAREMLKFYEDSIDLFLPTGMEGQKTAEALQE